MRVRGRVLFAMLGSAIAAARGVPAGVRANAERVPFSLREALATSWNVMRG